MRRIAPFRKMICAHGRRARTVPGFALLAGLLWAMALLGLTTRGSAAETIPPAPTRYFSDYANVVSDGVEHRLNAQLDAFERETSNQIVAAIFPKMPSDSSIEDFTQRTFEAWKVGQEKLSNGAVLFVFLQERRMRIQTGYGLEGALPDAIAKRIIDEEIAPHFRTGDYDRGLTAGINAMIAATRGEYQGTGRTVADRRRRAPGSGGGGGFSAIFILILLFLLMRFLSGGGKGVVYSPYGRSHRRGHGGWFIGNGGGGGGFWGGGGGGGSWGGGGGFSGGGGRSGGGGASGGW